MSDRITVNYLFKRMVACGLIDGNKRPNAQTADFSTRFLGLSEAYYRIRGEDLAISALLTLWSTLVATTGPYSDLSYDAWELLQERNKVNRRSVALRRRYDDAAISLTDH